MQAMKLHLYVIEKQEDITEGLSAVALLLYDFLNERATPCSDVQKIDAPCLFGKVELPPALKGAIEFQERNFNFLSNKITKKKIYRISRVRNINESVRGVWIKCKVGYRQFFDIGGTIHRGC